VFRLSSNDFAETQQVGELHPVRIMFPKFLSQSVHLK